jgi:hypothetical protein
MGAETTIPINSIITNSTGVILSVDVGVGIKHNKENTSNLVTHQIASGDRIIALQCSLIKKTKWGFWKADEPKFELLDYLQIPTSR